MVDLWSLRVLVAVADSGSLSGATEELALTQPAVSRQIANLERRLGLELFLRLPRGVRPTPGGELAIAHARIILAQVGDMTAGLKAFSGLESGRVRMSAFASAAVSIVASVVARFAQRHPGVEINLVDVPSADGAGAVRAGEIDLAVVTDLDHRHSRACDGVQLIRLVDDPLLVALPANHRLAAGADLPGADLRLADLGDETWIDGAHPDCLGELDGLRHAIGTAPRIGHVCDDWNAKQAFVAAGLGITLFPSSAAASARGDIVLRRPAPALPPRTTYLALPTQPHRAPATSAMAELFLAAAG